MKFEDVVKILIEHNILLCDYPINKPNITGVIAHLSKCAIKHNKILEKLKTLDLDDRIGIVVKSTLKRLEEGERHRIIKLIDDYVLQYGEKHRKLITNSLNLAHEEGKKLEVIFDDKNS